MHPTALANARRFFNTYVNPHDGKKIVDIGAQDVNGSMRLVAPYGNEYVGIDMERGKGVDVVTYDPYVIPLEDQSVDVVVSSSCFEHVDMFWVLYLEMLRVLRPDGLLYVCAPSNGWVHQYPVDSWRFYPDAGLSLAKWGRHSGYSVAMLESYISKQRFDNVGTKWNDFVAVFIKDELFTPEYPYRIIDEHPAFYNGYMGEGAGMINYVPHTEDQLRLQWERRGKDA